MECVVSEGTVLSDLTAGLQPKGIGIDKNMKHCEFMSQPSGASANQGKSANQPRSFVAATKSMFQLVSTCDITGRVQVPYLFVFGRYCGIIIAR